MNLYYFKRPEGNFGDDLNPWLWSRLLPDMDQLDVADWCVGIGTILDPRLDELRGTKLILGSGVRVRGWSPALRDDWKIGFVRGLLSSEALGIDPALAICDPALLVAKFVQPDSDRDKGRIGFIPHYHTAMAFDCREIAERSGTTLIEPSDDVESVLAAINSCDRVVCEAMHGAIVADALSVPWKRINILSWRKEQQDVASFKWADWAGQFGLRHEADRQPSVISSGRGSLRFVNRLARRLNQRVIAREVRMCATTGGFQASAERIRNQRSEAALLSIDRLKSDTQEQNASRRESTC